MSCADRASEDEPRPWRRLEAMKLPHQKSADFGIEVDFVTSWIFEMGCGMVIILSVLVVAWEVDGLQAPAFLQFMESAVTSFFLMEWLVRFKIMGRRWLANPIIIFDTFIVWIPGVLTVWAIQPMVRSDATDFLKVLRTVRMLRLLRVVLFLRHIKAFQDIFHLVRGLLGSGGTLLSALALIALTLYVFAILAIDLIGHQDFSGASAEVLELQLLFQGVFNTMFTLVRFMHQDDSQPILDILSKQPFIWIFLWLFTAVSAFVLLNLLTAIIIQQALEMASQDEAAQVALLQQRRERDLQELEDMFVRLDEDGNQKVTLEEFMQGFKIKEIRSKLRLLNLKETEMMDLFHILDTDGEGVLSLEEFKQGMGHLNGRATNKDMVFLEKSIERLGQKLQMLQGGQEKVSRKSIYEVETGQRLRKQLDEIAGGIRRRLSQAEMEFDLLAQRLYGLASECVSFGATKVPDLIAKGFQEDVVQTVGGAANKSKNHLGSERPLKGKVAGMKGPREHPDPGEARPFILEVETPPVMPVWSE